MAVAATVAVAVKVAVALLSAVAATVAGGRGEYAGEGGGAFPPA